MVVERTRSRSHGIRGGARQFAHGLQQECGRLGSDGISRRIDVIGIEGVAEEREQQRR